MWGRLQAVHPFRAQSSNPDNIINPSIVEAMPKYIPNSRFSDCWASVGNITFYHRNGQCYFRKKSVCRFTQTTGQIAVSEIHRRALAAWRTLDHDVQLQWNEYAKDVPSHRPPFDGTSHITGHNLFVSAYHGFAQIGNEHIPEPMPWRVFPPFSVDVAGIEIVGEDMILCLKVKMPLEKDPSRYRLHTKIQLAVPGGGNALDICGCLLPKRTAAITNVLSRSEFHITSHWEGNTRRLIRCTAASVSLTLLRAIGTTGL